jgi:GTP-binding protein EngB required for normal cell division/uncharacterized protein (DUF697 family)
MASGSRLKGLTALAIIAAVVVVSVLILAAADTFLSVWERLDRASPWLGKGFLVALAAAALFTAWTVWQLLRPTRKNTQPEAPPSAEVLQQRIEDQARRGVDVTASKRELEQLERRGGENTIYIAMFGEASSGKSSLINALLPDADAATGVRTGTTIDVQYHDWQPDDGPSLRLADLPGFGQSGADDLTRVARDEALRAHLVVYVCDGDLSRGQYREIEQLAEFDKPLVIALNKSDRLTAEELGIVEARIHEHLESVAALAVVPVSSGGLEEVITEDAEGQRQRVERPRPSDTSALAKRIERILGSKSAELMEAQRNAGLRLAHVKLADATRQYRRQAADTLVERYARRAVVGALAAVTPGTDIVIQGALAASLMRELCALYDVPFKELDVDRFLELAGGRIGRVSSIVMAVAGNALKAFPGVGTLAGGAVHAVAYGLIFDSLGRAVANCLDEQSQFNTEQVLEQLEGQLEQNLAARAQRLARLALSRRP